MQISNVDPVSHISMFAPLSLSLSFFLFVCVCVCEDIPYFDLSIFILESTSYLLEIDNLQDKLSSSTFLLTTNKQKQTLPYNAVFSVDRDFRLDYQGLQSSDEFGRYFS